MRSARNSETIIKRVKAGEGLRYGRFCFIPFAIAPAIQAKYPGDLATAILLDRTNVCESAPLYLDFLLFCEP